jgi:hypothetical protein
MAGLRQVSCAIIATGQEKASAIGAPALVFPGSPC